MLALAIATAMSMVGCGAKTGLGVPRVADAEDAGMDAAPRDAGVDSPPDSPPDVGPDVFECPGPVVLDPARAEVVLVLDRSASMAFRLGDSPELRISVMRAALGEALPPLDETVSLGAMLYPIAGASFTKGTNCDLGTELNVPIALRQSRAVLREIDERPPSGSTPTADALAVAHRALRAIRTPGSSQAILLATDGGPNCNPRDRGEPWYGIGPERCAEAGFDIALCLDDVRTLDAIEAAAGERIVTYVVGMDMRVDFQVDLLDRMAVAGRVPVIGAEHRFYDVRAPDDLAESLRIIGDRVARCTFVPRTDIVLETGTLTIDGAAIPMSETDGWTATPAGIELHGPTCTEARRPGATVRFLPFC